jgi:hypothetical protein
MKSIGYGLFLVALPLSTAAFAASGDAGAGDGAGAGAAPAAGGQPGAGTGQAGGMHSNLQEGRSAKTSPTNSPKDAATGVGGDAKAIGTPSAPNMQGN